jgi:hypothetical protein
MKSGTITPRRVFADLLEKHLPADGPDYVLVRLEFVGTRTPSSAMSPKGKKQRLRYDIVDKQDEATGLSAMMRTTAFPASIIAQMMASGDVPRARRHAAGKSDRPGQVRRRTRPPEYPNQTVRLRWPTQNKRPPFREATALCSTKFKLFSKLLRDADSLSS